MNRTDIKNALIEHCQTGTIPVVFVTGEAGMGKSTLLRAVKAFIAQADVSIRIADVDCSAPISGVNVGAVEALYPWIQLMRELATEAPTKHTKQLVTDLARAWIKFVPIVGDVIESTVETISIVREHRSVSAPAEPPASREHIFHQCVGFFCALAEKGRVVIMIDDAHWADDSSLNLLFALVRASKGNITCVVAYRPDDVRTSNQGGEHTILHVRRELERYDLCTEIIVSPMNEDELQALLAGITALIPDVYKFSGGNPFLAQGYVHVENGPHSKTSINAVIAEKLRRLDADQRDVLSMAAVEGETFTSLVLRDISPLPPLQIAQVLRKAEQDHMIIRSLGKREWYVTETPTYEFVNDALHIALENSISEEERELMHAAVSDVLRKERDLAKELAADFRNITAKLAVHAERAGEVLEAGSSWLEVADNAWRLYAEQEARSALTQALRVCTSARSTRALQVLHGKVLCLRGVIEQFVGNVNGALASYTQAIEIARETGDTTQHVIALCRAAAASSLGGDRSSVYSYATEALRISKEIPYIEGELAAVSMLGMWNESVGDLKEAEACFVRSLDLSNECDEKMRRANALTNIARLRLYHEDYAEGLPRLLEAAEIYRSLAKWDGMARALNGAGVGYASSGQYEEAARIYGQALELHERVGDLVGSSSLRTNLAQLHMRRGELDSARELINTSIAQKSQLNDGYGLAIALYTKGLIETESGEVAAAHALFNEALAHATRIEEQPIIDEIQRVIQTL